MAATIMANEEQLDHYGAGREKGILMQEVEGA